MTSKDLIHSVEHKQKMSADCFQLQIHFMIWFIYVFLSLVILAVALCLRVLSIIHSVPQPRTSSCD